MARHGACSGWPKRAAPEYRVWSHLRQRCTNPNDAAYRHYGGRGIKVCERWNDYQTFFADMGPRPSSKHTLERLNNDGHYEPGNCAWVLMVEQCRNRRSTRWVVFQDETISFAEACERAGVKYKTAHLRLQRGWSLDRALG